MITGEGDVLSVSPRGVDVIVKSSPPGTKVLPPGVVATSTSKGSKEMKHHFMYNNCVEARTL